MAAVSTNIKIDPALKQESQELFESFGLTLSAAINMFLRQSVREQAIPFRIGEPIPNVETLEAIKEVQELKKDPNKRTYGSFAELLEDLDA